MCSNLSVAWRGCRIPCSQLSTALELTFSSRANSAWLAFMAVRMARISAAFSGRGRGGISAARRSRLAGVFPEDAAFLRRKAEDRAGVIAGLRADRDAEAAKMADIVEQTGPV